MNLCKDCSSFDLSKTRQLYNSNVRHRQTSPVRDVPDDRSLHDFGTRSICIADVGLKYKQRPTNGCILCQTLYDYYQTPNWRSYTADKDIPDQLRAFPLFRPAAGRSWSREVETGVFILCLMQENAQVADWKVAQGMLRGGPSLVCYHPKETPWMLRPPGSVPNAFDSAAVRRWIRACESHERCNPSIRTPTVLTTLIDCYHDTVVIPKPTPPYIALSYVWGRVGAPKLFEGQNGTAKSFDRRTLPRTISDAMDVTKVLGYRYLWVDQLCIDQFNKSRKLEQIGNMDVIYMAAELTLVATAGSDANAGLPGSECSPREEITSSLAIIKGYEICRLMHSPRDEIEDTIWNSRAWTYQEAYLSRRLLYFTDRRVSFSCCEASYCEDIDHVRLAARVPANTDYTCEPFMPWTSPRSRIAGVLGTAINQSLNPSAVDDFNQLCSNISQYSRRALTFNSDTLLAFDAILNMYKERGPGCPFSYVTCVQGLPIFENSCVSRDAFLAMILGWHTDEDGDVTRRPGFPSWTWAGWKGGTGVSFSQHEDLYRGCSLMLLFEDVYVEDENVKGSEYVDVSRRASIFQAQGILNPSILGFFARSLPGDALTTDEKYLNTSAQNHPDASEGWQFYGLDVEVQLFQHRKSRATFFSNLHRGVYNIVAMSQLEPSPSRMTYDFGNAATEGYTEAPQFGLVCWILRKEGDFYAQVGKLRMDNFMKEDAEEEFKVAWQKSQEALNQSPFREWKVK